MPNKNYPFLLLTSILLIGVSYSCQTTQNKQLVGLWQIDYITTKSRKKLNLPWQGIKFKPDGSFVSWNTRQHFEGAWLYTEDTLQINGAKLDWMNSKWEIELYTHPDHYRKIIRGKLYSETQRELTFQLSKVHHLYVDEINAELISKPSANLLLLGKWYVQNSSNQVMPWLQFNENNTFLMGEDIDEYGNYGVWLIDEEKNKIDLISFSTAFDDISWEFKIKQDTLSLNNKRQTSILLKLNN